jgi:hypothetical protein
MDHQTAINIAEYGRNNAVPVVLNTTQASWAIAAALLLVFLMIELGSGE